MPSTYKQKDEEQAAALRELLATHHKRLKKAKVTIELLAAFGAVDREGNLATPAIMIRGREQSGLCKITKLVDRVAGLADVVILVDGDKWEAWTHEEQIAVVDHELTHVEIVLDGKEPAEDSHGRPKLKIRPHDRDHGLFDEVAKRNGEHSHEVQQARKLVEEACQVYFEGMGLEVEPARAPRKRRERPARPDA